MEQFISGESKNIFRVNSHKFIIGLTIDGKHVWQQEEEQKGGICTALMLQEQVCISELFKDTQDVVSLILHCRTMWRFRAICSNIFTILDVRSIFILSSTLD